MPDGPAALDAPTGAAAAAEILRDWLASATERFSWFKHVASGREVARATKQFARPSGNGRAGGRIALERAFRDCAVLEARGDEGRLPYLCWSIIRPRPEQRTVSVSFAATIRFADGRASILSMTWSIDAAEAALADALRHGEHDLDAVLMDAHHALLDAPARVAEAATEIAVPAGAGHFIGRFGQAQAGSERYVIFQAARWVPDQPEDAEPIGVARDGEASLAAGWLDPTRLAAAQFA